MLGDLLRALYPYRLRYWADERNSHYYQYRWARDGNPPMASACVNEGPECEIASDSEQN